jgi:tRNA(Leu) C34 or U34 (ribose-2'-O)-methylase TrmL
MKPEKAIFGKNAPVLGRTPAVALVNPKYPHNVGQAVRAASCWGAKQVWFSGNRVKLESSKRLPREERMKGYRDVELRQHDYFFDQFDRDVIPVAIELLPAAESLHHFVHPEKAVYIFGPEDGGLKPMDLKHCHRFVVIPTKHCLNLAAAVNIVLYDRLAKSQQETILIQDVLNEQRGFDDDHIHEEIGIS